MAKRHKSRKLSSQADSPVRLPIILAGGAAVVGLAGVEGNAAVTYDALNLTIDSSGSAGPTSATVNFPSIGISGDNTPAFTFTASSVNGLTVTKASGYAYYGPAVVTVAGNTSLVSSIPAGGVISSANSGTYANNKTLISANGSSGQFNVASGLRYIGYQNTATSGPATDNWGWIGFQTLSTGSDVSAKITGIALESTPGLAIIAGSTTSDVVSNLAFNGAAGNGAWNIGTTANWYNGSGTSVYHDGDNVTLNDTDNTSGQYNLTLDASGATINPGYLSPNSLTVNTSNTYTLNGAGIGGYAPVIKNGSGSLVVNIPILASDYTSINQGNITMTPLGSMTRTPTVTVGVTGSTSGSLILQPATTGGILLRYFNTINVNNGSVIVQTALTHSSRSVLSFQQLAIGSNSTIDLSNNDMLFRGSGLVSLGTKDIAAVTGFLASGYSNGNWNGTTGIISSAAAVDTTHLTALGSMLNTTDSSTPIYSTFDGQTAGADDVLVKYTYYGDANLDGIVDGSDYSLIDNGALSGYLTGWYNGDFNYDGVIDGSDYTLIDNAFNAQGASLAAEAASTAQIAGTTAVPEPTSLGLLALGAVGLTAYRRRSART